MERTIDFVCRRSSCDDDAHAIENHLIAVGGRPLLDIGVFRLQTLAKVHRAESNVQVQPEAILCRLLGEIHGQRFADQSKRAPSPCE